MSHKKIYYEFIIFNLIFVFINCFSLDSFRKSIYASINENKNIKSLNKKKDIEIEYLILKYEDQINNIEIPYTHKMSIYINPKFYHSIISLDAKDNMNFYTLKNNLFFWITTSQFKRKEPYTIINEQNKSHVILERLEYFDEYLNEEKNISYKNYWNALINNEKNINSNYTLEIEQLLNNNLLEINNAIKDSYNKIGKWCKDNSYELFFIYDKKKSKFIINKIFVYYIRNETKSTLINLNQIKFENILIEQGDKIYNNFNFKKYLEHITYINNTEYNIKISTNKKDSIYHNMMSLKFDEKTLNKYYNNTIDNNICIIIHYILTEDVYIEKNEFLKRFEEILISKGINKTLIKNNIKYNLYASNFIEQELSSDLSEQAYFSFILCTNKDILDILNNTLSYTIHFRYQPSLNINSNKTHQLTIMPQPFVYILNNQENNPKNFLDEMLYNNNIFKEEKNLNDNLKIFEEEIMNKKMRIINQVNILNDNYYNLIHEIPAGQKKYFLIVTFITVLTSFTGFFIIFWGVMKYISAPNIIEKMKKIE
jgi:hypothetical protein